MRPVLRIDVTPASGDAIRIAAVGDFCLQTEATRERQRSGAAIVAPEIAQRLRESDLSLANVECPIDPQSDPAEKAGARLRGISQMVPILRSCGVDIAGMANNHILDFGADAMRATRDALEREGLRTVGVGESEDAAAQPLWVEIGELEIAVFAFAEREFAAAGSDRAGASVLDPVRSAQAIRAARERADLVIASVHGGNENYFAPSPRTQSWYRGLVEAGADAVLGHHPHAIQGVEVYEGAPIVYSLGNFVLDAGGARPPSWDIGMMIELRASKRQVHSIDLYGFQQERSEGARLRPLTPEEALAFESRQEQLNRIAASPEEVEGLWRCFCAERRETYNQRLLIDAETVRVDLAEMTQIAFQSKSQQHIGSILSQLVTRIPWRRHMRGQRYARLVNLFQCPAHHEVMTTILQMQHEGTILEPEFAARFDELIAFCR